MASAAKPLIGSTFTIFWPMVLMIFQPPAAVPAAITHAQVWTVTGATIDDGTVVVTKGKISAVGKNVKIPAGAEVIDAKGGALTPGIIDCHSHIAIEGGVNEGTLSVTSMVAVGDVVNPDDIAIYRALAGGVTSANLLHGSARPFLGSNYVWSDQYGSRIQFAGLAAGEPQVVAGEPDEGKFLAWYRDGDRLVGALGIGNARLLVKHMDSDVSLPFMRPDPALFWSPTPGWRGEFQGKPVTIDALGLRGGEVAIPKPRGRTRVVCCGD